MLPCCSTRLAHQGQQQLSNQPSESPQQLMQLCAVMKLNSNLTKVGAKEWFANLAGKDWHITSQNVTFDIPLFGSGGPSSDRRNRFARTE
jgi:hypothetical protein